MLAYGHPSHRHVDLERALPLAVVESLHGLGLLGSRARLVAGQEARLGQRRRWRLERVAVLHLASEQSVLDRRFTHGGLPLSCGAREVMQTLTLPPSTNNASVPG